MLEFWDYNYLYYWNKVKIKCLSKPYLFCSITMVFQILVSAWNIHFFLLIICLTILNSLLNVIPQIETIMFLLFLFIICMPYHLKYWMPYVTLKLLYFSQVILLWLEYLYLLSISKIYMWHSGNVWKNTKAFQSMLFSTINIDWRTRQWQRSFMAPLRGKTWIVKSLPLCYTDVLWK